MEWERLKRFLKSPLLCLLKNSAAERFSDDEQDAPPAVPPGKFDSLL
jgi:hypothetical protein